MWLISHYSHRTSQRARFLVGKQDNIIKSTYTIHWLIKEHVWFQSTDGSVIFKSLTCVRLKCQIIW